MSTPPVRIPTLRARLRRLSAILTGILAGFFAGAMLLPDWPSHESLPSFSAAPQLDMAVAVEPEEGIGSLSEPNPAEMPAAFEPGSEAAAPSPMLIPVSSPAKQSRILTKEEMSAALQPLLSFRISDEDAKAVKLAIEAASRDNNEDALAAIKKISDPAARNFAEWKRLRAGTASFREVMAFRAAHPFFPEPPQDTPNEKALFLADAPAVSVLKFYTNRLPLTGAGHATLGGALMETGERERGLAMIKLAWTRYPLDPEVEPHFRARFGALLSERDHRRRAQMLAVRAAYKADPGKDLDSGKKIIKASLKSSLKSKAGKKGRGGLHNAVHRKRRRSTENEDAQPHREAALGGMAHPFRVASFTEPVRLKKASRKKSASSDAGEDAKKPSDQESKAGANTRQAKAAENAFKLTKAVGGGPGTLLSRLKALRREGADDDLWSLLRSIDPNSADLADPDRFWDFRRSEVRRALSQDHPKTAYAIAKTHGPLDGENLSEAEFLAGWIALRFLKDPLLAAPHFEASRVAGFSRTEARASYWLARAKLEVGAVKESRYYLADASRRFYTFYGALAREALHRANTCEFRAPTQPSARAIAAFVNEDAFKAIMIAKQLDMEPVLNAYVLDLARQILDPQQMTLVMELAQRITGPNVYVRAAKIALMRGYAVEPYAYPALLPKYGEAGENAKLDPALVSALTRQESEFYTGTISPVGARGLMQLMPQTAKTVAASVKMKYELSRLISDPSYNVTLGSAFLAQLLSGYDGSYLLTLAAYNAGPGRVAEWMKDFGDPRDKGVDSIDWIERIPFTETRQYVHKIVESTQVYRCRLENPNAGFQIVEDLHRGRPGKMPDFEDITGSAGMGEAP